MSLRTYLATGVFLRAMESLLKVKLRITGAEHLVDRPTLFVVNHFTRFETMVVPYAIYRSVRRPVRSLADHKLFKGVIGKYLRACGNISTREPLRNRIIIGDLMTGRIGWVIYPEGVMVKNKKIVHQGRLRLHHPKRQGPPHSGAALLALKAQISKQLYLRAADAGRTQEMAYYQDRYHFNDPGEICRDPMAIVPVNITYYPLRPDKNVLHRLTKLLGAELSARVEEELQVEGRLLLGDTDMSVHFCQPLEITDYLDQPTRILRQLAGLISPKWRTDLMLRRQATRLTHDAMRRIYQHVEVNFDHLFCYALRAWKGGPIPIAKMRSVLYLSALELRQRAGDLRLHPQLTQGLTPLLTNQPFEPIDSVAAMAVQQGVLRVNDGCYHRADAAGAGEYDFHELRVRNTVDVIANELEPIDAAVGAIQRNVRLADPQLHQRTSRAAHQADRHRFHRDYHNSASGRLGRSIEVGEPFFLESPGATVGVVLVHGYLAAPAEIRPLAEYLHAHGVSVYGVSLKGHGTVPTALTRVNWQDWARCVQRGCAVMRPHCEKMIVGGFSLGGLLALHQAAMHGDTVDGVFSVNGAVKLCDRRSAVVPAVVLWNRLLRAMRLPATRYEAISNANTESPDINYTVNYLSGVRQLRLAIAACRKKLARVSVPVLIVQADADPIVHPDSGAILYENLGCDEKFLVEMGFDRHVIVRGHDSEKVFEKVNGFLDRFRDPPPGSRRPLPWASRLVANRFTTLDDNA